MTANASAQHRPTPTTSARKKSERERATGDDIMPTSPFAMLRPTHARATMYRGIALAGREYGFDLDRSRRFAVLTRSGRPQARLADARSGVPNAPPLP